MKKSNTLPLADARTGLFVFLLCWIVYFTAQIGRLNYSVALTGIVESGLLPKSTAGLIGTAFYICYGCGQIISGFLGDRFSPFVLLFLGTLGSALANLATGLATGLAGLTVAWGCNGLAQSLLWTPLLSLFANVLPEDQRRRACVNISTTTPLGILACYLLSNWAMASWDWRAVFIAAAAALALCAAVWAVGSVFVLRQLRRDDTPARRAAAPAAAPAPERAPARLFGLMLISGVLFMTLPIAIQSVLKDGMTTWTPTMLAETYDLTPEFAVTLTMLLPVTSLLGGYAASFINKRLFRNELKTSAFFFAVSLPCLVLMFFAQNVWLCVAGLCVVVFSMHAVNIMIISFVPLHFAGCGRTSTLSGLLNATAYAGGAISTYGIGWFAERFGWPPTILLWVGVCALAMLTCMLIVRRWTRFVSDPSAA